MGTASVNKNKGFVKQSVEINMTLEWPVWWHWFDWFWTVSRQDKKSEVQVSSLFFVMGREAESIHDLLVYEEEEEEELSPDLGPKIHWSGWSERTTVHPCSVRKGPTPADINWRRGALEAVWQSVTGPTYWLDKQCTSMGNSSHGPCLWIVSRSQGTSGPGVRPRMFFFAERQQCF